jgi:phenylacetate-CoA ligase
MRNYLRVLYYLHGMMKRAYSDRGKLIEHQNRNLRRIVKYAYDYVPFYHQKLKKRGMKPSDIRTVKDLCKLPIIRKDEIRRNLSRIISKKFDMNNLHVLSTSGSTGQPLRVFISKKEDDYRKAKHLTANIFCGQKPRDRYVTITSPSHFGEVPRLLRVVGIFDRTFISVFEDINTQISTIEKIEPDVLAGYSSSLLLLAKEVKKRGIETIKPRFILGGAELIDDFSRRFIEEVFDAPFYDQYAIVELDRIAWQCPAKLQYHIDADSIIVQFLDETGEEVSAGEKGEIVCTSLFNYAMPFIRYSVGDIGIPSEDECPCGLTLPLMKVIEGRKDSLLTLPDGRLLSPRTFTIAMNMFKSIGDIDQFRVIQKETGLFTLHIKKKNEGIDETTMENELVKHIGKMLNVSKEEVTFEVEFRDNIPFDKTGKFSAVVSELKK